MINIVFLKSLGAVVAEWLSSWLAEQDVRGSIYRLATWISEIGYLPFPSRDIGEIPLKRRKSSIQQPTKSIITGDVSPSNAVLTFTIPSLKQISTHLNLADIFGNILAIILCKGQITICSDTSPLDGRQFLAIPFAFDLAFKMHFKEKGFKHSIN